MSCRLRNLSQKQNVKKKLCFAKEIEKTLETQPVTKSELYLNSVGN